MVDQRERVLYQHDKYRIVAWAERFPAERAPRLYVRVDERRAQFWHNVVTWHARPSPAPWWKPWERKNELLPVVERCVRQIEELEHADRTAEVTIDAVAEVMDAVAPLVASLSPAHPRRYDRVRQEQHAHGDEDPPLYRAAPGSDLDMLAKGAERLRREAGERLQRPK